MTPETFQQYCHKADNIVAEVKKSAAIQNEAYLKKLLQQAPAAEQLVARLQQDKAIVRQEAEGLASREYYRMAGHYNHVGFLYLSRLVGLGRDEEKAVKKCCLVYEKEKYIDTHLEMAKKQLAPLTFHDYLTGKSNAVLFEPDEISQGAGDEEIINIMTWQTSKKIRCTKLEFGRMRESFIASADHGISQKEKVHAEKKQLMHILSGASIGDDRQLACELQKLQGMAGISMPEDREEFYRLFLGFLNGNDLKKQLTPVYFETAVKNIETGTISGMPVFGLSLFMYYRWLTHFENNKIKDFEKNEFCYEALFSKTFIEGEEKRKTAIDRFRMHSGNEALKGRHYETYLLQEIEKKRKKFISLEYLSYFNLMENRALLKDSFVNHCLRSFNFELPKEELIQTIILNETIDYLNEELCLLKHKPLLLAADHLVEDVLMLEIICHMAPNPDLINKFLDNRDWVKQQMLNDRIPMYFIHEKQNGLFTNIFEDAKEVFKKVVAGMSTEDIGFYVLHFLRDIHYMETSHVFRCIMKHAFFHEVKHILKSELKRAQKMTIFRVAPGEDNTKKIKYRTLKPFAFGYNAGPKPLKPILKALILKINLLQNGSTLEDLWSVFTCPDLGQVKIKIYIGCQTNFFYYIRKKLAPWLDSFSPAQIEKSGIFITCNDEPMTANNLYNSKFILWEDSQFIDSIFDANYE